MSLDLDDRHVAMLEAMGFSLGMPLGRRVPAAVEPTPRSVSRIAPASAVMPVPSDRTAPVVAIKNIATEAEIAWAASAFDSKTAPQAPPGTFPADPASWSWPELRAQVVGCQACPLANTRRNAVFGSSDPAATVPPACDWLIVGDEPDEGEDLAGRPFVGPAGQLLGNMLRAVGLAPGEDGVGRAGAHLTNAVKCRPPTNRAPTAGEIATCGHLLARQVDLLKPRVILGLGRFAIQALLGADEPLGRLRGRLHNYRGVPVVFTYHPRHLRQNPQAKANAWADLCLAADVVDRGAAAD